jgi:hypothetical protein
MRLIPGGPIGFNGRTQPLLAAAGCRLLALETRKQGAVLTCRLRFFVVLPFQMRSRAMF